MENVKMLNRSPYAISLCCISQAKGVIIGYVRFETFPIYRNRNLRKDKLYEISGGKCVAADVSTAAAVIFKANDARGVAVTSAWQPALFLLDNLTNNQ